MELCSQIIQFSFVCDMSDLSTMIIELIIALSAGSVQTTTGQAADVLESDWVLRINDICSHARKNPWFTGSADQLQVMQCDGLQGINSQIEDILKLMPNPPI